MAFPSEIPPVKPIVYQISVLIDGGGLLGGGLMGALPLPQVVAGLAGASGGSLATLIFPFRPSDIRILSGEGNKGWFHRHLQPPSVRPVKVPAFPAFPACLPEDLTMPPPLRCSHFTGMCTLIHVDMDVDSLGMLGGKAPQTRGRNSSGTHQEPRSCRKTSQTDFSGTSARARVCVRAHVHVCVCV